MSQTYDYYYIGDQGLLSGESSKISPTLLSVSKVKNGVRGEIKPHMHAYAELFYFESGYGTFHFGTETVEIKPHDVFLVNANLLHLQDSDEETPLTYYCFAIDDLTVPGSVKNCPAGNGFFHYSFNGNNPVYESITGLLGEFHNRNFGWYAKSYALFNQILIDIIRCFINNADYKSAESVRKSNATVSDVKDYLTARYTEQITLDDLSHAFHVSKSHLLRIFKSSVGISPMQYLTRLRIEQARLLLGKTAMNVTEISGKVGFDNPVYFTEVFSRLLGVSPSVYRKIIKSRNI